MGSDPVSTLKKAISELPGFNRLASFCYGWIRTIGSIFANMSDRGCTHSILLDRCRLDELRTGLEVVQSKERDDQKGHAVIISYTGVSSEPRVKRQAKALTSNGWKVSVIGFRGNTKTPEEWDFYELPSSHPYLSGVSQLGYAGRIVFPLLARLIPSFGLLGLTSNLYLRFRKHEILGMREEFGDVDLVLCHDYFTSDVGWQLAQDCGAKVIVDCHEYAMGQYVTNLKWRLFEKPIVRAVQKLYYPKCDGLTTVSSGICELLNKEYKLKRECITIRSISPRCDFPFRRTNPDRINVLYHGNIDPIRGLDLAVESLVLWRAEFHLVLRGYASPGYSEHLNQLAETLGVSDRFHIEDAVPFDLLIAKANEADVGYFVHDDVSPQKRFVLPNKFFEYIQAGLALCVSDLPEMAKIVNEHDLGILVDRFDPEDVAENVNSLTAETIDSYKQSSISAREELSWESEQQIMLDYYYAVMSEA